MAKYVMVVPSAAKEGQDAEYNTWYDNQHIHDICALPGVTSGTRFTAVPEASMNPPPTSYLTIYEIETDDIGATMAEMGRRAQAGQMPLSDALDLDSAKVWIYQRQ